MNFPFSVIVLTFCLSAVSVSAQREWADGRKREDPNTWNWNLADPVDHVTHGVVYSSAMGRDIGHNIYLPPSYHKEPKKRYSVIYFLHGAGGDEKVAAYTTEIVIPEIEAEHVEEAIFVFLNGGHWSGYRDSPTSYVKPETYIIEELIPAIDQQYRTISDRSGRAIFGFSMGGGGSIRLALKYPDLFCAVGSFSGALNFARNPQTGEWGAAREILPEDNIFHFATLNQEKIRDKLGIFLTVGGSEWLYDNHPAFIDHLHSLDVKFNYIVKGDLGHNWGTSKELFGSQVIRFLGSHYRAPVVDSILTENVR